MLSAQQSISETFLFFVFTIIVIFPFYKLKPHRDMEFLSIQEQYLKIHHGYDKGYLIDMCMEEGITPEFKLLSEKENENGETVCREIMIFTKPFVNQRVKK